MEPKTVLLVEDQIDFLAINKVYLERHGYRVLAAEDGVEGIRTARTQRPDLIVMDFSMPQLDGVRAAAELKRDPHTRDIPIVLLTAHAYGSVGRRAKEAGCASFIAKPCEPWRILKEIQELIGQSDLALH
jgi:two-component system, cell cycle response regulator DivK